MKSKIVVAWCAIATFCLQGLTIKNIDDREQIIFVMDPAKYRRELQGPKSIKPGKTVQGVPDWGRGGGDLTCNECCNKRIDFYVLKKGQKFGRNSLEIGDFRTETRAKILMDPSTMVYVYFDPKTELVEYKLEWTENGKKMSRQSEGFGGKEAPPAPPAPMFKIPTEGDKKSDSASSAVSSEEPSITAGATPQESVASESQIIVWHE